VTDELKAEPHVTACFPLRFVFEETQGGPAMLIGVDLDFLGEHAHVPVVAVGPTGGPGTPRDLKVAVDEMIASGDAVACSANFVRRRNLALGDRVEIHTPSGPWRPRILAVLRDYTSEHGTIYIDRAQYWKRWDDRRANAYDLFLEPGTDVAAFTDHLRERYGAKYDLFFTENQGFKKRVLSVVDSAFTVTYAMQVIAIGVALLGVVTTLYAAILERTREVGVLRAVGATRGHIGRAVITEAFLLGAIASGFALAVGGLLGYALVARLVAGAYGWDLAYSFPLGPAIFGVCAASFLAATAGALPAARAARISIVEALAYG
jgi:putative ABC transport system permease protein